MTDKIVRLPRVSVSWEAGGGRQRSHREIYGTRFWIVCCFFFLLYILLGDGAAAVVGPLDGTQPWLMCTVFSGV